MKKLLTTNAILCLLGALGCGEESAGQASAGNGATAQAGGTSAGAGAAAGAAAGAGAAGSSAGTGAAGAGMRPTAGMSAEAGRGVIDPSDAGAEETPSDGGGRDAAPDSGEVDTGTMIPADSPAPQNVGKWANAGPFDSRVVNNSGPDGQFTVFLPVPLAGNGKPNPIITWGNGSTTTPSSYRSLLSHYATHGFFVVASNNTNVGSGREMIAGMRWAIEENARSGSDYFGKLDPNAVGSIGYSQGGIGAVIAGNEPEVKTTVPIAGGDESITNITHPIFLIGNEDDTAAPIDVISPQFTSEETTGPFVFGVLLNTGHLETLGNGGRHRGYTTAWLAYHLLGQQDAYRVFYGDDKCTLCIDPAWETQRKNLP